MFISSLLSTAQGASSIATNARKVPAIIKPFVSKFISYELKCHKLTVVRRRTHKSMQLHLRNKAAAFKSCPDGFEFRSAIDVTDAGY